MESPLITVAIPVYNAERFIEKSLQSVIAQTYKHIEIIIVDNASTDATLLKVERICLSYNLKNIRIIRHETNKGLGASKNTAIAEAKGKYLYFMDSDDYIEPDTLDYLMSSIGERDDIDVVIGSFVEEDLNGSLLYSLVNESHLYEITQDLLSYDINLYWMTWNKLYRLDFLKKNKIKCIPHHLHEDLWFTFQVYAYMKLVLTCERVTYHYVSNNYSICNKDKKRFTLDNAKEHIEILEREHGEIKSDNKRYSLSKFHLNNFVVLYVNTLYSIRISFPKRQRDYLFKKMIPLALFTVLSHNQYNKLDARYKLFYWSNRIVGINNATIIDKWFVGTKDFVQSLLHYWKRKIVQPIQYRINHIRLRNRTISIISNNCWGAFMYKQCLIPYSSPFVNLFIYTPDYIKLLRNIDKINDELTFISHNESKYKEVLPLHDYPIGVIVSLGVEIHFLHFKDMKSAREKWEERLKRLDLNNCIIKLSDDEFLSENLVLEFEKLKFENKVFFSARPYPECSSNIYMKEYRGHKRVWYEWDYSDRYYDFVHIANEIGK